MSVGMQQERLGHGEDAQRHVSANGDGVPLAEPCGAVRAIEKLKKKQVAERHGEARDDLRRPTADRIDTCATNSYEVNHVHV